MRLEVKNTQSRDGDFRWKTLDDFSQTYWSGLDAAFYANDVHLDELISLQWKLDEAVAPLYTYASYTYDTLMHGARRVQGAFTLNFKREGSLFELLSTLAQPRQTDRAPDFNQSEAFRAAAAGDATLEHFIALAAGHGTTHKDQGGRLEGVDPRLLRTAARDFEAAIWGEQRAPANSPVRTLTTSELGYTSLRRARFELANRFELSIHFGSFTRQPGERQGTRVGETGVVGDQSVTTAVGTSQKLIGVALTSREVLVDDSGRPCLEQFSFIARDVI